MANRLKMAVASSIYTLREQGLSQRQIARLLRIDRETVRRHFRLMAAGSNPAGAPPGSVGVSAPIQPSACEPFRDVIASKLEQGLTAQRIWQDLVSEHGFAARYHSVRRYVQKLSRATAATTTGGGGIMSGAS